MPPLIKELLRDQGKPTTESIREETTGKEEDRGSKETIMSKGSLPGTER